MIQMPPRCQFFWMCDPTHKKSSRFMQSNIESNSKSDASAATANGQRFMLQSPSLIHLELIMLSRYVLVHRKAYVRWSFSYVVSLVLRATACGTAKTNPINN